ncbi:50S ribosomal protein L11 methyltransferase [Desulfoluna sp.]|uniref:50S ribosomal protein L11 methyltransferase n=1 Tax=Desulfoluna sp. TaxID=2045199 RepID=UPI002602F691|nr:50S ribosomal protein L11 methyltransferase [Desulfoluna sp.]
MPWLEIRVTYSPQGDLPADELIANEFSAVGIGSVSVTLPDMEPVEGWDPGGHTEDTEYAVTGYLSMDGEEGGVLRALEERLSALFERSGIPCEITTETIPDTDWNESWKENFKPVHLTERFVVCPTWETYDPTEGEKVLLIDPGMAFGTGTHPTTRLCVEMIEHHTKEGMTVLDVGTGSGILLVAASLSGAREGLGVDNDPVAVETAAQNLALNQIPESFSVVCADLISQAGKAYDLVVANILAEVVVELLGDIHQVVHADSIVILSGILDEKGPMVEARLLETGFSLVETHAEESWLVMVAQKKAE